MLLFFIREGGGLIQKQDVCGMMIKQIHDTLEKQANNSLREQDLTLAQMMALLALQESPEKQAALKELEQILCVAQSTTAGIIARLEQKGFVEGFGEISDKRIKMVRITDLGEQCCKNAERQMTEAETKLLSGLTETEQIIFKTLLKKVIDTIG
jgi:DNA-binding MarR family transcriptional regulator